MQTQTNPIQCLPACRGYGYHAHVKGCPVKSDAARRAAATRKRNDKVCNKCWGKGHERVYLPDVKTYGRIKCEKCNGTGERQTAFVNPYSVGDILKGSWGYDQTNIEFYQVVATTAHTVTIQEVSRLSTAIGSMVQRNYPAKDSFIGKPERRQVSSFGYVKLHNSCYLSKWEGKGEVSTHYA